LFVEVSWLN